MKPSAIHREAFIVQLEFRNECVKFPVIILLGSHLEKHQLLHCRNIVIPLSLLSFPIISLLFLFHSDSICSKNTEPCHVFFTMCCAWIQHTNRNGLATAISPTSWGDVLTRLSNLLRCIKKKPCRGACLRSSHVIVSAWKRRIAARGNGESDPGEYGATC